MKKYNRIVIFSGGELGAWALAEIKEGDFLLGADRGALFLIRQGIKPHYVMGDFDSVNSEEYQEIRDNCGDMVCFDSVDKDYTDTELAFNWAVEKQPAEILMVGVTGSRFDHSLANLHLLRRGLKEGILTKIIDQFNEISLIDKRMKISKGRFKYVSILPFSSEVTGINLEGFKYPLQDALLKQGVSLGISNELKEESGKISIKSGELLVIRSSD